MAVIEEIKALANGIDVRINLFEGYQPKNTASYKGELLFWRQVVNAYGLLADCDSVQIKQKKNLLELMSRYYLIEPGDFKQAQIFWKDISNLRKWFCHNNNPALFYKRKQEDLIKKYLRSTSLNASNKPDKIENVSLKDWNVLSADINRRFTEYLMLLKKGFCSWKNSPNHEDLIAEWIDLFSVALYEDRELRDNVLADIAEYNIRNQCLHVKPFQLARNYARQIENGRFSALCIKNELEAHPLIKRSNREILTDSIRNSGLL